MVVFGILPISLSTIQKVYHINDFQIGIFLSLFYTFFGFFTFFMKVYHKSKKLILLGMGMIYIALGCLAISTPLFFRKDYLISEYNTDYTHKSFQKPFVQDKNYWIYYSILGVGFSLIGVGSSPLFTISLDYIADLFDIEDVESRTRVFHVFSKIGAIFTSIIGTYVFKLPLFPGRHFQNYFSYNENGWLGAFWILFLIGSVYFFIFGIDTFMIAFKTSRSKMFENLPNKNTRKFQPIRINNFSKDADLAAILKNFKWWCLMYINLSSTFVEFILVFYTPMYLEVQFHLPPWKVKLFNLGGIIWRAYGSSLYIIWVYCWIWNGRISSVKCKSYLHNSIYSWINFYIDSLFFIKLPL